MSAITLTSSTRAQLLSLQNTASSLAVTQNRLATGKAVGSALDNPVNYFTASALSGRSSDLASLLDGISNGVQATRAAIGGLETMRKMLNLAQSLVDRANRTENAVQTPASVSSVSSTYTALDVVGAQSAMAPRVTTPFDPVANPAADFGLSGVLDTNVLDFSGATMAPGDTITVSQGGTSKTFAYRAGAANGGTSYFNGPGELQALIGANFTVSSTSASASTLSLQTEDTAPLTVVSSNAAVTDTHTGPTLPDRFSYTTDSGLTQTFVFHTPPNTATDPANHYFSDRASLVAAINAVNAPSALRAGQDITGRVYLVAADQDDTFTLSGSNLAAMGYGPTTYRPTPSLDDAQVTYAIGKGIERKSVTIAYGYAANETTTLQQLNQQLATADMVAAIEPSPYGKVVIKPMPGREADDIELSTPPGWTPPSPQVQNGVTTLTGSASGQYLASATLSEPGASTRRQIARDYAALRDQITTVAQDSGYNGVNLLTGGSVNFQFNEANTSGYQIQGAMMDADGIGLLTALDGDFLDSQSTGFAARNIRGALDAVTRATSAYTTGLTTAGIRSDFTKRVGTILGAGADALTNADMNAEAARANSLGVRNQLANSALGLAGNAQQQILQLLRA